MDSKNKVVLVDWNIFVFRAIYACEHNKGEGIPPTYTALSMLLSCLKHIGCHPDDLIIMAIDSPKGSWRRQVDSAYKANRKEQREKHTDIDWPKTFASFKSLVESLKISTPFCFVEIDYLEADDIIATSCRYYKDREVIVLSSDSDYEQLCEYKNVKILSPICKKGKSRHYKIVKNPTLSLANKIKKETTDNLITEILTEEDYKKREKIVSLLTLPFDVENQVSKILFTLEPNINFNLSKIPFKTLRDRFMSIYGPGLIKEGEVIKKKKKKLKQLKLLL
jgi:5'-3' exonuclease